MSISDCIQIIENRFYSDSNLVLQFNKDNIKNEVQDLEDSFYESMKDKSNPITDVVSHETILQYQKSLDKCQIVQNSQTYQTDQFSNSIFDYKLHDNTSKTQSDLQNSFLNSPSRIEHISNPMTTNRLDSTGSALPDSKGLMTKKCKVCADKAVNQNFGVLSCESCKAFFRRNAIRSSPLKCSNGSDVCNVTSSTRKQCPSCRLKKCLSVGMRSELIQIRKNNPKVNSNKRKSTTIQQDGSQPKWMNRNSNGSNSSGRLSQDNNEEPSNKIQTSTNVNVDFNGKSQCNEATIMQPALWLDTNNLQSQINNQPNFWVSMNNGGHCDTLKANILSTNYMNNINTHSMTNINSLSQSFDPIKYDLQIPMIKIKTNQSVLQPIALLPAIQGSVYTTSNIQSLYSSNNDTKVDEFNADPLLSNEIVTELAMQTFYQTNTPNYIVPDAKSFNSSHPSAFYPFNIQSNNNSTSAIFYNSVSNSDLKSTYLWDCCTMPTSDSSINTDHNSFISMDSGSDPFYSNHTYPNSSSSSQKFYLSPDKYEGSKNNPCFMSLEVNEDLQDSDLPDIIASDDLTHLLNSVSESSIMSRTPNSSNEHEFILQIGQIWENTLGKTVTFYNRNGVNINIDLKPMHYGSLDSVKSLVATHNWENDFINLSEIFLRQLKVFLTDVIALINWDNELVETLKFELKEQLDNHLKTPLMVLMPVILSNFISAPSDVPDDNLNLDKEVENYLFQDLNNHIENSQTFENTVANFMMECDTDNLKVVARRTVNCQIDLSLLSNRLLDLNSINYSSLQYLDKYCSGLCNFLSPSPVLFGLFSILKIIVMRTNVDYCDPNWNDSLLKRDSSPLLINHNKTAKLIYHLKSIFLAACDIVQTDTIDQRLQSLDQFLSWGKSQFDNQWIDFFNNTIKTKLTATKRTDCASFGSSATKKPRADKFSTVADPIFSDHVLNEFGYHYCDVFTDI